VLPIKDNIPTRHFPVVTVALIAINAAVWLFYELPNLERAVLEAGWFPCEFQGVCDAPGPDWPVDSVTSMFMHGSWIHIIGNMLFLWIFGNNVEDAMGRVRFLVFYLAAGFAATALQSFVTFQFGTPEDAQVPNVGASGAIAGVLGAYILLYPHARVLTFVIIIFIFTPFQVPAWIFLGIWFLFQLWQGGFDLLAPTGSGTGGVAFFAHIGGFVFGLLAVYLFTAGRRQRRRRAPAWPRAEL
jgi:membrane associated rhomboid family serine protease